ncbi:MAG: lamin tail domain-containing protein [Bacteroidales bacterium]|nr:lamin tail domain-containing protein [Bacteroidales bacterium]
MSFKNKLCLALLVLYSINSSAQLFINEILASNSMVNADPASGEYSDWLELYNAGNTAVNLNGYYLTDNLNEPEKWQISENVNVPARGYLLIWCDDIGSGLHSNFKLSASGEEIGLFDPSLRLIDSLTFGAQFSNISYARYPDGAETWRYYTLPSPALSNGDTGFAGQVDNAPEFLQKGGMYSSPLSVELFTDLGGTIRYTLDGSEPTEESPEYTEPIQISSTKVVRARIFKPNFIPGYTTTSTYFINEDFETRNLPVISIATDSANFWDPDKGIYLQYYKPEWEYPINLELFENNGSDRAAVNERAGVKVNGKNSWELPQKMLGIYFRKQYENGKLEYPLFHDRDRNTFDNFALRVSGSDWSSTLFRDGLIQKACHQYNMDIDNIAFRPCIVYVNGEYLGIHNLREKANEDYIVSNHHLEEGSFDLIENIDGEKGVREAAAGDLSAWNKLWALIQQDLSIQANFDSVASYFDIDNFSDLITTQYYTGNTSISNNLMYWKPKEGGKWRWILMDLDRGFIKYEPLSFLAGKKSWPLAQLMTDSNYVQSLCKRIADHLYTGFNYLRMSKRIDYHKELIEAEMPRQLARWYGTTSGYGNAIPSMDFWDNEVAALKTYAEYKPVYMLKDLRNYGISDAALLSLSASPSKACTWEFNNMRIDEAQWLGYYPMNLPITLKAVTKPGYTFMGWIEPGMQEIIAKGSEWKYLDKGSDEKTDWYDPDFDDVEWSTGNSPLGYDFDDIATTVSFGPDNTNKFITTYFRKKFNLSESTLQNSSFVLKMRRDDGAVVYLNGKEIIRTNMPAGEIKYNSLATESRTDTTYHCYPVDASALLWGDNVIAVEMHQVQKSSSDLFFDLQLIAESTDNTDYLSTSDSYTFTLTRDKSLRAVFREDGQSVIPETVSGDLTLYKARSPYLLRGDVTIAPNATLSIEPGVVVMMPPAAKFMINGSMQALGNAGDSIVFMLNPAYDSRQSWGALCFINTTDTSRLSYVSIRDASDGPKLYNCVAAISAYKSNLVLDHLTMTDVDSNPIAARYSDIVLTNSEIRSRVLGDLINVKYGKARIENCRFSGNSFPDTDGIDYDEVQNGVIKNVVIRDFEGSNCDAIDIGEATKNVKIDSVLIYNISDKGISAGQRSTVFVKNASILNTNLGFGIKDSSCVFISNSTFYGVATPVACYEKIVGRAGGNAYVSHSILSNSYDRTYLKDARSTIFFSKSLSDNDSLPGNPDNLYGDPGFVAPGYFDFSFINPFPLPLGSSYYPETPGVQPVISEIFFNGTMDEERTEFIGLYHPGQESVDLSGYTISHAIDFTFPQGSLMEPGTHCYIVKDLSKLPQWSSNPKVYEWASDRSLSNEGEAIRLNNAFGMAIDQVVYSPDAPWPYVGGEDERVLSLLSYKLDNHLAENWTSKAYELITGNFLQHSNNKCQIWPNPTRGIVHIKLEGSCDQNLKVYTLTGKLVYTAQVQNGQVLDLGSFAGQLLLVRIGDSFEKLMVLGK